MKKNLIEEIVRVREIMIINEGLLLIENFGREIMQRAGRQTGFNLTNVMDEIDNSNFFEQQSRDRLRTQVSGPNQLNFFDVFLEEYNKITDIAKKRAAVSFIAEKVGLKPAFDDAIYEIENALTRRERNLAIRKFIANFNDPSTKRFFERDFDNVTSPKIKGSEIKGDIDKAMDDWDTIPEVTLSSTARGLLSSKVKFPKLRQDIYNFFTSFGNIYLPYLLELLKIIKLRRPNFDSVNQQLIENLTNNIVGKLKKMESLGDIDNKYMVEINMYMKSIWNDANNLRLRYKKGIPEGVEFNANIIDWFSKRLEEYGFSFEERQIIMKEFAKTDPTGKGAEVILSIAEQSSFSREIIDSVKQLRDDYLKTIPEGVKSIFKGFDGLMTFGNPLMSRREIRILLYDSGLQRVYAKKIFKSILVCNFLLPAIVSFMWACYQSLVVTFDKDSPYYKMGFAERFGAIFKEEFNNKLSSLGIMDFIWPWSLLWDNFYNGFLEVLDSLSKGVYDGANAIEKIGGLINDFILGVFGKTKEYIQKGRERIENSNNSTESQDTIPAERRDSIPPELQDTIPIDTSGGFQPA